MSRGSPKQGSQELLHGSPAVLTRLPASTDVSASSIGTAGSDLLVTIRVLRVVSASGVPVPAAISASPTSGPQVHVTLLPLVQIQKVSLIGVSVALAGFSPGVSLGGTQFFRTCLGQTRTPASWLCTPSYDGTLDEPRCTPCSLASKSTSHHELSALPEMVLNLKDFAAKPIKLSNARLLTS